MSNAIKTGTLSYVEWGIWMDAEEHEGKSVWDGCAYLPGTPVYLIVQTLPAMACSIGQKKERTSSLAPILGIPPGAGQNGLFQWVNAAALRTGAWPASEIALTVGCSLWVQPSWQAQPQSLPTLSGGVPAPQPAPVFGSLEGVDVRPMQGRGLERLQVWTAVTPGSFDLIVPQVWLRHPSGVWSVAEPSGPPSAVSTAVFDVAIRDADRVYLSYDISGFPSGQPVAVGYGNLTAPSQAAIKSEQFVIRFGAVRAPMGAQ